MVKFLITFSFSANNSHVSETNFPFTFERSRDSGSWCGKGISHISGQRTNTYNKSQTKEICFAQRLFCLWGREKLAEKEPADKRPVQGERKREIYGTMSMSSVRLNEEKCTQFQINSDNGVGMPPGMLVVRPSLRTNKNIKNKRAT